MLVSVTEKSYKVLKNLDFGSSNCKVSTNVDNVERIPKAILHGLRVIRRKSC